MIGKSSMITHTQRVCKDFEIKKLGKYHDLYVQSDTLLYLRTFRISDLKYMNSTLLVFWLHRQ